MSSSYLKVKPLTKFNWLNVEAEYDGDYDYHDQFWGLEKTGCDDTVHFEWTAQNGTSMQTEGQCGCLGGYDHPTCEHGRESIDGDYVTYLQFETEQPKEYTFKGTSPRVVLTTDWTHAGGKVSFDWQCKGKLLGRDPFDRMKALKEKILEVVEANGWEKSSLFMRRVSNKVDNVSKKSNDKRYFLIKKGCKFPNHWNWQEYLVSSYQLIRYKLKPNLGSPR